jgi:hypothetical protein
MNSGCLPDVIVSSSRVLLEAGAASGREPTANVELRSDLGQSLQDLISRTHFRGSYFYLEQMRFANSDAIFATGELSAAIGNEYKASARFSVSVPTHPGTSYRPVSWSFGTCCRTGMAYGSAKAKGSSSNVIGAEGAVCGAILWESKRTKLWAPV